MNSEGYKEVYFDMYCHNCIHFDKVGDEEPCDECLSEPMNIYSHKPSKRRAEEGELRIDLLRLPLFVGFPIRHLYLSCLAVQIPVP